MQTCQCTISWKIHYQNNYEDLEKILFDFYVGHVEEDIRSRRIYLCNLHGSVKGLWHIKPWFADCQAKRIWIWSRRFEIHEKVFSEQRVKGIRVNKNFSEWERITKGVLKDSILELLLFNIFLNGIFCLLVSNSSLI